MKHLHSMTPDELLVAYRETAAAHGRALEDGDARSSTRAYDRLTGIRKMLRQTGQAQTILTLLDDTNPAVRRSAAVDALELAPDRGVDVLRAIAAGPPGMVRLDAEMVLKEWEAGRWQNVC